jgi:hypothetical protein
MTQAPFTYHLDVRAEQYYRGLDPERPDPARVDGAIVDAITRIEEWSYEQDAHGYCHDRTNWIALVAEVLRLRRLVPQVYGEEVIDGPEGGPEGLIEVKGYREAELWILTCSVHGELGQWPVVPYEYKTEPELAWEQHLVDEHPPSRA